PSKAMPCLHKTRLRHRGLVRAASVADATINAPSSTGLFLESTLGLYAALALLTHQVSESRREDASARVKQWKKTAHRLKLF
ncbi:MAG: hypothetical protein AAGH83_11055, partial [Pseudomonadota bacterium]